MKASFGVALHRRIKFLCLDGHPLPDLVEGKFFLLTEFKELIDVELPNLLS